MCCVRGFAVAAVIAVLLMVFMAFVFVPLFVVVLLVFFVPVMGGGMRVAVPCVSST